MGTSGYEAIARGVRLGGLPAHYFQALLDMHISEGHGLTLSNR